MSAAVIASKYGLSAAERLPSPHPASQSVRPPADVLTPELLEALYGVRVAVTQVLAGGRSFSVCTPYGGEEL